MLSKRLAAFAALLFLLVPSAWLAWSHRDLGHPGLVVHDEAIYVVAGRSIALGQGPKILSLPGAMSQTKYPPLLPALASLVWLAHPEMEGGGPWFALLGWSPVALLLPLTILLYRRWGVPVALVAFLAVNGYVALFSTAVLSELLFTAFLVATMLAVDTALEHDTAPRWILAGLLASLAYLTRTVGIVLIVAIPLSVWLMRRNWRRALWASAAMLPVVASWSLWVKFYRSSGDDHLTAYYADYFRDLLWNASISSYHLILWKNLTNWLSGIGTLLAPFPQGEGMGGQMLSQALAVGALMGTVRLCRATPRAIPFAVSAAAISLMLVAWCYPPNERLVFPVFPLLLAGFWREASGVVEMLRSARTKQPGAAIIIGAIFAGLAALILLQHVTLWRETIPELFRSSQRIATENIACYQRVRAELPAGAAFVAQFDPVLWMYTGRRAVRPSFRTALWYEDRNDEILAIYLDIVAFSRHHGLGYVFQNLRYHGDLSDEQFAKFRRHLETDPALEPVFACGEARVWRVR